MIIFLPIIACLVSLAAALTQHVHNASFIPDAVLHVTAKNASAGGIYRLTTLVNGTSPGPALYLPEKKVIWIRVYNDMPDRNTTMVCYQLLDTVVELKMNSIGMVSHRLHIHSLTAPHSPANGRFHHYTSLIMSCNLRRALLEPISTILMLASRLQVHKEH